MAEMNRRDFLKTSALTVGVTPVVVKALPTGATVAAQKEVYGATKTLTLAVNGYGPWPIHHHLHSTGLRIRGRRLNDRNDSTQVCRFRVVAESDDVAVVHLIHPSRPRFFHRFLQPPVFSITIYAKHMMRSLWNRHETEGHAVFKGESRFR